MQELQKILGSTVVAVTTFLHLHQVHKIQSMNNSWLYQLQIYKQSNWPHLWMLLTYKSSFLPGTKFGPIILAFMPVDTMPEKTRPNAKNRPLSDVGTILETYIISGPCGSQLFTAGHNQCSHIIQSAQSYHRLEE